MTRSLCVVLATALSMACTDPVTQPSRIPERPPPAATAPTEVPPEPVEAAPVGLLVTGPRGCVDAATLPPVVVWTLTHIPDGAVLTKGYHFDDTVNCERTVQQQRTQNDNLRFVPTAHWPSGAPSGGRVEFDRDADCRTGRQQPDFSADGVVLIGVIITRPKGCATTPKPPTVPPVVTSPTIPPVVTPPVVVPPASCPYVWILMKKSPWSECSTAGTQTRTVYWCAHATGTCPELDKETTESQACTPGPRAEPPPPPVTR